MAVKDKKVQKFFDIFSDYDYSVTVKTQTQKREYIGLASTTVEIYHTEDKESDDINFLLDDRPFSNKFTSELDDRKMNIFYVNVSIDGREEEKIITEAEMKDKLIDETYKIIGRKLEKIATENNLYEFDIFDDEEINEYVEIIGNHYYLKANMAELKPEFETEENTKTIQISAILLNEDTITKEEFHTLFSNNSTPYEITEDKEALFALIDNTEFSFDFPAKLDETRNNIFIVSTKFPTEDTTKEEMNEGVTKNFRRHLKKLIEENNLS